MPPTPSQDILEQKKEKQLSILETVAENLETELEESTTCSNVSSSSSSMGECFIPKGLETDFTREEIAKSDWQLSQLATTGTFAPEGGGGGVSDEERAEAQAQEQERLEQERLEQERLEQERLQREQLEREQLERERLERERLERERLERERLQRERLERERLQREREREAQEAELRKDVPLFKLEKTRRVDEDDDKYESQNKKVNYTDIGGSKSKRTKKSRIKKTRSKRTKTKKFKSKRTRRTNKTKKR